MSLALLKEVRRPSSRILSCLRAILGASSSPVPPLHVSITSLITNIDGVFTTDGNWKDLTTDLYVADQNSHKFTLVLRNVHSSGIRAGITVLTPGMSSHEMKIRIYGLAVE